MTIHLLENRGHRLVVVVLGGNRDQGALRDPVGIKLMSPGSWVLWRRAPFGAFQNSPRYGGVFLERS